MKGLAAILPEVQPGAYWSKTRIEDPHLELLVVHCFSVFGGGALLGDSLGLAGPPYVTFCLSYLFLGFS